MRAARHRHPSRQLVGVQVRLHTAAQLARLATAWHLHLKEWRAGKGDYLAHRHTESCREDDWELGGEETGDERGKDRAMGQGSMGLWM